MILGAFESDLWDILVYGLLGLVQGLTEFLPVSSSGHLTILGNVLSTYDGDKMSFAIVVHFATALSTIVVFRKDIAELAINFFKPNEEGGLAARKYVGLLAISAIPAAIIGFTLKDSIE
jgi:undecaprenyl-diphosphatase